MLKGLIGKKIGMTRLFLEEGRAVPVTVLQVGPCTVVQVKTPDKERYSALQLGFGEKKAVRVNKPGTGHFAKAGVQPKAVLREFKVDDTAEFQVGQEITAAIFARGEKVNVTGRTKGRGFAGVVKRHNFGGGRDTPRLHHPRPARLHRRQRRSRPGGQGPPHAWPLRRCAHAEPEPQGGGRSPRGQSGLGQGRGARGQGRHRLHRKGLSTL